MPQGPNTAVTHENAVLLSRLLHRSVGCGRKAIALPD